MSYYHYLSDGDIIIDHNNFKDSRRRARSAWKTYIQYLDTVLVVEFMVWSVDTVFVVGGACSICVLHFTPRSRYSRSSFIYLVTQIAEYGSSLSNQVQVTCKDGS